MKRQSNFSFLNMLILLGFIGLALLIISSMLNRKESDKVAFFGGESGGLFQAQVAGISADLGELMLPAFSQRDRQQYLNEDEYKLWSASACSATATAALLNGLGKPIRTSDVLAIMRENNAIRPESGLYDYSVFKKIGDRFNLRTDYREGGDLNSHFNSIITNLKNGIPVIINVIDAQFFPNGHFVAAFRYNSDDTVSMVNPDPLPGRPVIQNWNQSALKTYFSRSPRSAAFFPKP
ncbi:C39 family peptidase [Candidatus Chlorohelix sp.]|uniref:C39 family peptidase n=1 Tax=Candidatus Chlorohelix sp. TaxID=3139201 RepID=UPI00305795D3